MAAGRQEALARFDTRMGPGQSEALVDYAAVTLGYRNHSSAVLGAAGDTSPLLPTS